MSHVLFPPGPNPKPKLLVLTSTFVRDSQDLKPRFILDLVKAMVADFDILVLAPSFPQASALETIEGVKVARFRYAPFKGLETLTYANGIIAELKRRPLKWLLVPLFFWSQRQAVLRLLKEHQFDAIHAHWSVPQGLIATSLPKRQGVPVITTCHGGDVFLFSASVLKILPSLALRRSKKVVAVSEELRGACQGLIGEASQDSCLERIPMGIHLDAFTRTKGSRAKEPAQGGADFVITFVGRLVEKKGVKVLIEALRHLPAQTSSSRRVLLQIVGDGPLRKSLQSYAASCDLADRVQFLGWRSQAKLPKLLQASDACVVPSVHAKNGDKDGLPVTLIEAAAAQTPVVASNIAGIPDFLRHNENGLLCPPGDVEALAEQIGRLMADQDLGERLSRQAFEDVRAYDWSVIAGRYAKVIRDALETP